MRYLRNAVPVFGDHTILCGLFLRLAVLSLPPEDPEGRDIEKLVRILRDSFDEDTKGVLRHTYITGQNAKDREDEVLAGALAVYIQ